MRILSNAGIMSLASMFVGIMPLTMGVVYALWPTEQRLNLTRILSLAAIFAAVSGATLGSINELVYVARTTPVEFTPVIAVGLAETLVPLLVNFGCLTVAWLCVAIGMWRRP